MGVLVNGQWQDKWYDTQKSGGEFKREAAQLRNWVTADGSPGPSGDGGFAAESGRYHLYVSLACPWAHRTLIFRKLKGLESHIPVSVVSYLMLEDGWTFDKDTGSSGDALFDQSFLHQLYTRNKADYSGRVTVPVLWDTHSNRIVSNESAEIIRMFNSAFNELTGNERDFYPEALAGEIDDINAIVYDNINNGVYKAGFATSQEAYEAAYDNVFATLDALEDRLARQRYLVGKHLTEADWRLFTSLIRFDAVYHGHFKCNRQKLSEFPHLFEYVKELYQYPGISETVDFTHIKGHYYGSHRTINPTAVVPKGPDLDWLIPHQREGV
ncbi:glutathione S-transferase family protein [Gallaecimonas pentaromativorans]|uniref:Putative glutathione S-transferase n=1 Tax=Gallaecimonas pentaromativorans TaxID=584787 RepID=A0A3N1NUV6_9GAMM|nr:glutathione S-transferase family protein [Gallaecimonas pentaromativorans]MED5525000.1 glutathione S-transferase family protein [Pseudomonadota bacterium]ROQ18737.1 putative glutathione S-transferase [Gallaecimonas pentaromativorans]